MRPVDRIDEFTTFLNYIWKTRCPDWRFGQLIFNVFAAVDPFYMEEDTAMDYICGYFKTSYEEIKKEMEKKWR